MKQFKHSGKILFSSKKVRQASLLVTMVVTSLFVSEVSACASCGCTLNTDWGAQGMSNDGGWSLDLRYDYVNQDRLRFGSKAISQQAAATKINSQTTANAEVEGYTKNNYITASIDYNNGDTWGATLLVPYINRSHMTYGSSTTGDWTSIADGQSGYSSKLSNIGDIKLIGRYYGFLPQRNLGIQIGLKVPTGKTNQYSNDGMTLVDPGLQLGTGSTDLIVGAYYFDGLTQHSDYFVSANYQAAVHSKSDFNGLGSYRPGNGWNMTAGVRYHGLGSVIVSMQLNARVVDRDGGAAADQYATGGTLVYLSPGVIVPINDQLSLYGTIQLPIYQNVNGVQLTPKYIGSVGVRVNF